MSENWSRGERLYNLLPAIYRVRDAEQGEPLRALLAVMERELETIEADIEGLYDDWFIETASEWLVPYIGDLLGVRPLHTIEDSGIYSLRAYVANTLRYRRGKGKATILEQLALDVTGWRARAVEFFQRLIVNQHLDRVRYLPAANVDIHHAADLELIDTPFDKNAHTGEVRRIASRRGKYNIPNLGLFLWRLESYPVFDAAARETADADGRYHFNPLGIAMPLFNNPQSEDEIHTLAQEVNVPGMLRRRALADELRGRGDADVFFGVNPVLEVFLDDHESPLAEDEFIICNLNWDDADWVRPVATGNQIIAVDPQLGRLCVMENPAQEPDSLRVSYSYGFSGDVGGGAYNRQQALNALFAERSAEWSARVTDETPTPPDTFATLGDAVDEWNAQPAGTVGVIAIDNSRSYFENLTLLQTIEIPAGSRLIIAAAAPPPSAGQPFESGIRLPHIHGDIHVTGTPNAADPDALPGDLVLHGLRVEGSVSVLDGDLGQVILSHTTLVPGRRLSSTVIEPDPEQLRWRQTIDITPLEPDMPSLDVHENNTNLEITLNRAITGALRLPDTVEHLTAYQSIIDSGTRPANTARVTGALLSGSLSTFPTLTSATPRLRLSLGGDMQTLNLPPVPASLPQARDALQSAIDDTFGADAAYVTIVGTRLAIVGGDPWTTVYAAPYPSDDTFAELRLSRENTVRTVALLGEPVPTYSGLSAASPAVTGINGAERFDVPLTGSTGTLAQTRDTLQAALRDADAAFDSVFVVTIGDRLAVISTDPADDLLLGTTEADRTTLYQLGLDAHTAAISATANGRGYGPPVTLEQVTIFGGVTVREMYASEVIFNDPARCERTQTGCVRFSYVPAFSRVPRRYRCQPDLAIKERPPDVSEGKVRARVRPIFTATDYGDPAYCQLSEWCAEEIRTGAEDESEMGVFSYLKQPQREANLRVALDEYLRAGLEAGTFFVT